MNVLDFGKTLDGPKEKLKNMSFKVKHEQPSHFRVSPNAKAVAKIDLNSK